MGLGEAEDASQSGAWLVHPAQFRDIVFGRGCVVLGCS